MDNFMLGVMVDCSRNAVPTLDTLKQFVGIIKKMGYNRLELYTEDTYEIEGQPYFGYMRGRYSASEIKELDATCAELGVELAPCIQVLAHLNQIFRWNVYKEVNDFADILLVDEPKTYQLIEDMFKTTAENFTSRNINIGCDEAHMIGLGKFLDRFSFQNRFDIINRHLKRVLEIADKYGFKCSIWSDMYFRLMSGGNYYNVDNPIPDDVINGVPKGLSLIYWDYYNTDVEIYRKMFAAHKRFNNPIEFAGGAWKWTGFAPENRFSNICSDAAIKAAKEMGVNRFRITAWGDNGAEASCFSVLPALYYFARLCKGKGVSEQELEKGFKRVTGVGYADFFNIEKINDFDWQREHLRKTNAEKYYLYNDYFLGFYDDAITGKEAEHYRSAAAALKQGKYGKYAYIFNTVRALCNVLEIKADIGVRTRALYKSGDKEGLGKIVLEYEEIVKRLKIFYKMLRQQWYKENKTFGFEVQDVRIGGLIQRTQNCKTQLQNYLTGKVAKIEELEQQTLPCSERYSNVYTKMVTAGIM